jgi:hypothetical protein
MIENTQDQKEFERRTIDKPHLRQVTRKEYDQHLSELECAVYGKAGGSCGCMWDGKEGRFVKR